MAGCDLVALDSAKPPSDTLCAVKGSSYSIKKEKTEALLQRLAAEGSLRWRGKSLCFDPFAIFDPFFILDEGGGVIAAVKNRFFESLVEELDLFLPARPPLFILKGGLYLLRHPLYKWIMRALVKEPFTPNEQRQLLEDLHSEGPEFLIDLRMPKIASSSQEVISCQPLVILKKKAPQFANLYFQYGKERYLRDVCAPKSPCCLEDEEKFWEEIFQKSGYFLKRNGDTAYFVPSDKMFLAIKGLLKEGFSFEFDDGTRVAYGGHLQMAGAHFQGDELLFDAFCLEDGRRVIASDMQGAFALLEDGSQVLVEKMPLGLSLNGKKGAIAKDMAAFLDEKSFFSMSRELVDFHKRLLDTKIKIDEKAPLWCRLYPFQKEGVRWLCHLYQMQLGGIMADQMGLGKTVQILALIEQMEAQSSILIAVPKTLVSQWQEQIALFCPHLQANRSIEVVSHHQLLRETAWKGRAFDLFCIDESHVVKNPKTQLYAAFQKIEAKVRFCITGTPIFNRLEELWSQMSLAMPALSDRVSDFIEEHRQNPLTFTKKLAPFYLRRIKEEVAIDLPSKEEKWIFVDMGERELDLYEKVRGDESNPLETLLRLRQIVLHPALYNGDDFDESEPLGKTAKIIEDLVELYENGEKVLLFTQFASYLGLLSKHLTRLGIPFFYMDGQTEERQNVVDHFTAATGAAILLLTLQVGGVGLNLQSANWVVLAEPWWNSAVEEQAIDRAHRIGRTAPLTILRYIAKGTLEEKMEELKEWKRSMASHWC